MLSYDHVYLKKKLSGLPAALTRKRKQKKSLITKERPLTECVNREFDWEVLNTVRLRDRRLAES